MVWCICHRHSTDIGGKSKSSIIRFPILHPSLPPGSPPQSLTLIPPFILGTIQASAPLKKILTAFYKAGTPCQNGVPPPRAEGNLTFPGHYLELKPEVQLEVKPHRAVCTLREAGAGPSVSAQVPSAPGGPAKLDPTQQSPGRSPTGPSIPALPNHDLQQSCPRIWLTPFPQASCRFYSKFTKGNRQKQSSTEVLWLGP